MSFRGRGAKSRGAAPPPNLIALGGRGRREVRGRPGQLAAPSSTGLPAATQHGISSASLQQSSLAPSSQLSPTTVAEEFVQQVLEADASEDIATVNDMLLEALLVLKSNPTDPDRHCYLSLLLVAKRRPSLFGSEKLFEALLSVLHRDSAPAFKRNNLVPVLACNILYSAFQHRQEWPLEFVQVYMDDVLGARVWVEDEYSKAFVQNVQTCFPDPLSPMDPLLPNKKLKVESGETSEETPEEQLPFKEEPVNRYPHPEVRELIRRNVVETLNYYLHSQAIENARNLIKLLTITAGYKEARMFGSQYLEDWLSNASTVRYAKEYIPQLAQACNTTEPEDLQALNNILTLKVKGLHAQLFLDCISVLLRNNKEYPAFALKSFIHHEVLPSLQKGTPNIKMLATIFHTIPEHPELELSFIFAELAANDEYTPILKPLLSKVVKAINTGNTDFCNFVESFVQGLMQERQEMFEQELSVRERWVINLVELICYSVVLSVPAQLLSEPSPSSKDNLALLRQFRFRMARIQKDCMVWCHSLVYRYLPSISPRRYSQIIHRLLFLEHLASYIDVELTPEVERGYTQLLFARVPVLEDTITLITVIHLTGQPLYNVDALECMDRLLKRAAAVQDDKAMEIKNVQLVEAILKLTIYTPPSSDKLQTPSMQFGVTSCFWKACLMLLLIASHNPQTIGQFIWQEFPTAKLLMEMLITRHYHFPPMHWSYAERVEAEEYELQQQHKEKAHIIELENRIANVQRGTEGKIIDEANSVLLHQLIEHNPYGHVRCPSATVLDDLRNLDLQYRLGHKLCSNRNPDYLLDIMQRHGALESMKWLGPIIQAEPETLDVLPVSCLCELLLTSASPEMVEDMLSVQLSQELRLRLISRLLLSLKGSTIEPHSDDALQIFSFFLQKLSARQLRIRHMGRRGLALLLYSFEDASEAAPSSMVTDQPATAPESIDDGMKELPSGYEWLQTLSKFPQMAQVVQSYLYRALLRETEAVATYSYLVYLSYVTRENGVQTVGLANEVGRMIVTRSLVAQQLLKDVLMYSRCLEIMSSALEYLSSVQQENLATLPLPIVWLYPSVEKPFPLPAMVLQGLLSLLCLPLPYLQEKKEEEKQKDSSPLSPALLLHSNLTSLIIGSVDMKQTLIFADAAATQQVPFPSPEQAFAMTYSSHPLLVRAGVHALGLSEKLRLLSSCWGLSKEGLLQVLADLDDIAEHHRDALLRQIAQLQQPIQLLKQAQRCLLRLNTSKGTLFINAVQGLFSEQWPEKSMASAKPTIMRFLPDEFLTSSPLVPQSPLPSQQSIATAEAEAKRMCVLLQTVVVNTSTSFVDASKLWQSIKKSLQLPIHVPPISHTTIPSTPTSVAVALLEYLTEVASVQSEAFVNLLQRRTRFTIRLLFLLLTVIVTSRHHLHIFYRFLAALHQLLHHFSPPLHEPTSSQLRGWRALHLLCRRFGTLWNKPMISPPAAHHLLPAATPATEQHFAYVSRLHLSASLVEQPNKILPRTVEVLAAYFHRQPTITQELTERILLNYFLHASNQTDLQDTVNIVLETLLKLLNHNVPPQTKGLLIDWLQYLDGEVSSLPLLRHLFETSAPAPTNATELQEQQDSLSLTTTCDQQPYYLLAAFIHRASWLLLRNTFACLLSPSHLESAIPLATTFFKTFVSFPSLIMPSMSFDNQKAKTRNCSSTLDFVAAYLNHPRSWQGYVHQVSSDGSSTADSAVSLSHNRKANHQTDSPAPLHWEPPSPLLDTRVLFHHFSPLSVCLLSDYVLLDLEGSLARQDTRHADELLSLRMPLLVNSVRQGEGNLHALILHLANKPSSSSAAVELLHRLSLEFPQIISLVSKPYLALTGSSHDTSAFIRCHKLDILVHRELRLLGLPNAEQVSNSAYIMLRNLGTQQPALLLRHLMSFATLLEGRAHLTMKEFVERQYHRLYSYVLGILDVLRPLVFYERKVLKHILGMYFTLLRMIIASQHIQSKHFASLISKFVEFLCHYALAMESVPGTKVSESTVETAGEIDTSIFTTSRKKLLMEAQQLYPSIKKLGLLREILEVSDKERWANQQKPSIMSLPFSQEEIAVTRQRLQTRQPTTCYADNRPSRVLALTPPGSRSEEESSTITLATLNDLDVVSLRSPSLLLSFIDELLPLLRVPQSSLRSLAYKLVLRLLHHSPSHSKQVIPHLLLCFEDEREEIQKDAVLWSPDLLLFCDEHTEDLLYKVFTVANALQAGPQLESMLRSFILSK